MTAKEVYQQSHEKNFKKQYPQAYADGHYFYPKQPDTRKANGLTKFVIDIINWNGGYANRISSSGRVIDAALKQPSGTILTGKKWIPGATRKGTADIHAIIQGQHWSIEIKIGKDRISEHQHSEQKRVQDAGGNYMIVKDADSFLKAFNFLLSL
jgi:hypothetical protein